MKTFSESFSDLKNSFVKLLKEIRDYYRPKTIYLIQEYKYPVIHRQPFCTHGFKYTLKEAKNLVQKIVKKNQNLDIHWFIWQDCEEIDSANNEWHFVNIATNGLNDYCIEEINQTDERYSI